MTAATEVLRPGGSAVAGRSAFNLFWLRFREDKVAIFGGLVILFLILLAIFGAPIAAHVTGHPNTAAYPNKMEDEFGIPLGPNNNFWFGADGAGRDLFVRTMYGARTCSASPSSGPLSTPTAVARPAPLETRTSCSFWDMC